MEHPKDRPTFSDLRNKFSTLLMATTNDPYMVLEVDEAKTYYTMGEDEEEEFKKRESWSSIDSETGLKKEKKPKKIEKPKWATDNPYVKTPSTFKDDHAVVEDEHYRTAVVEVEKEESPARNVLEQDDDDDDGMATGMNLNIPLSESLGVVASRPSHPLTESTISSSVPPTHLLSPEEHVGIPLSFISGEKPTPAPRQGNVKRLVSNPYVDDPKTKHPLEEEGEQEGKVGSLMAELSHQLGNGKMAQDDTTAF